mgnify:CR=1 FL=1
MEREKNAFERLVEIDFRDRPALFQPLTQELVHMGIEWLGRGWELAEEGKAIQKIWQLASYQEGVDMTLRLARLAEELNHHPDIYLGFKRVVVRLTTHKTACLTLWDFAMASRIETL